MELKAIKFRAVVGNPARRVSGMMAIPLTTQEKFDPGYDEDLFLALKGQKVRAIIRPDREGKDHAWKPKGQPGGSLSQQLRFITERLAVEAGCMDEDAIQDFYTAEMKRLIAEAAAKLNQ